MFKIFENKIYNNIFWIVLVVVAILVVMMLTGMSVPFALREKYEDTNSSTASDTTSDAAMPIPKEFNAHQGASVHESTILQQQPQQQQQQQAGELRPEDLLPKDMNSKWAQVNPVGQGMLSDRNFLDAGHHVGVNTVGQSMRNANYNVRSEPPNPQIKVSPWMESTIDPDLSRKALEIGMCS